MTDQPSYAAHGRRESLMDSAPLSTVLDPVLMDHDFLAQRRMPLDGLGGRGMALMVRADGALGRRFLPMVARTMLRRLRPMLVVKTGSLRGVGAVVMAGFCGVSAVVMTVAPGRGLFVAGTRRHMMPVMMMNRRHGWRGDRRHGQGGSENAKGDVHLISVRPSMLCA
jgi:hypothetical protein